MGRLLTRRNFLRASLGAAGAATLAACGATPTPQVVEKVVTQVVQGTPQVVKETVVVKETAVVEKEVTVAAAPTEKAKIVVYECCWNADHIKAGKALYETFRQNNPNLDVEDFWPLPDQGWLEVLLAKVAANEQIDIIWWCAAYQKFAQDGRLLDLQPLLDADQSFKLEGTFFDPSIDYCYDKPGRKGPVWGLPTNYATVLLWYNIDMFDKAGVKYPDDNWTYDDLLTAAKALTKVGADGTTEEWGFTMSSDAWYYEPIIKAMGGGIVDVDGAGCLLTKKESVDALQWLQDLLWKYKVQPLPENTAAMGEDAMFISGKLAMVIRPEWAQFNFLPPHQSEGLKYGVALMPKGPAGRVTNYWPGITSITSSCKAPKAAWEVAKFITSDQYQRTMTVFLPESPAARIETTTYRFTDYDKYPDDRHALLESPKYGSLYYEEMRYGNEMTNILKPAMDPVWLNQAKPAEVVGPICDQMTAKIAELKPKA
jgi:multiple sugar transport system substrate-binding protein